MPGRIVSLFRNLQRKNTVEQALDEELQSSVELLTEEKMKDGLPRAAAHRQALIEVGGVEQVKEEVRAIRVGAPAGEFCEGPAFRFSDAGQVARFYSTSGDHAGLGAHRQCDCLLLRERFLPSATGSEES